LVGWLVGWLAGWLVGWLVGWFEICTNILLPITGKLSPPAKSPLTYINYNTVHCMMY
jgi:hypothetical protein